MAPKTNREHDLEKQIAKLEGMMAALMANQGQRTHSTGKIVVGIRNISSYTIGLINTTPGEEGELQLAPEPIDCSYSTHTRAVISETYWQTLKKGKEVRKGCIMRDDSFLTGENVAPPDRPEEIPADFHINAIPDPIQWIESRTEEEIRDAVFKITSEPSLRRLQAAVTWKIKQLGEEVEDDKERGKKALRALPGKYHRCEQLVLERLDEFMPNHKNYQNERSTTARF